MEQRAQSPLECYELCVQSPRHVVSFLHSVHGNEARTLREDFCGTAAVSRRWIDEGRRRGEQWTATGVDLDQASLDAARRGDASPALSLACADCVHAPVDAGDGCDIVFVGNFSIGYIHTRGHLLTYFRACRERLERGNAGFGGGCLVLDAYGGPGAFALGSLERTHVGRGRETIKYLWRHEVADPRSGMVVNSISFRVLVDGEVVQDLPRAFVYQWRLWSLPELGEALREVGLGAPEVYTDINVAPGQAARPVDSADALRGDWVACVVSRQGISA